MDCLISTNEHSSDVYLHGSEFQLGGMLVHLNLAPQGV